MTSPVLQKPGMKRSASARLQRTALSALAALASATCLFTPAQAKTDQALSILLRQLQAKPLGLYDGMRLFRIAQPGGGSFTLSVSCEREQWRVQNYDTAAGQVVFTEGGFLDAKGIGRTSVCTEPMKGLE